MYTSWIHSGSTIVDGVWLYPWSLHPPTPYPIFHLHKIICSLPPHVYHCLKLPCIFYMNCEHIQLSVKLPFSLWVFEKRDDMLYSLCLMLSTLWTFKAWWWKRSASASSHLKVSHFRLLDFYWFSKQTAWSYCLICLQQIKCSSKCWFLFPFSAFFQGLSMQNN